jgi:hypothetical protein
VPCDLKGAAAADHRGGRWRWAVAERGG